MLSQEFLDYLSNLVQLEITACKPISGGDISSAFLIETSSQKFFLKVNNNTTALKMFKSEELALKTIAATKTIAVPNILTVNSFENNSFLIMDFIESKSPNSKDLELFGEQLSSLHKTTSNVFGFEEDNLIGSLFQSNKKHKSWNNFYIEERLIPQFQLARSKGLLKDSEIPESERMKDICFPFFRNVNPSLLHGDLWSGNYLISSDGKPYLIDPAIYFGHHEVDIAMSKLFGGFGYSFYNAYHKIIPKDSYTETRIELYQLYYLLVHLNLFGSSYYGGVMNILNKYFGL